MIDVLPARISHNRRGARKNAFAYGALYLVLPLERLSAARRPALFSLEAFNLFSFRGRDHGDGRTPIESWAKDILARAKAHEADGEIILVTLPRVLGFVFNPVSFWMCMDRAGRLRAVIAEVNNTYGERHPYVCRHPDGREISKDDWLTVEKSFHVSPFLSVEGHYKFRFAFDDEKISIAIHHYDNKGLRLTTALAGPRKPMTSAGLAAGFLRYPFVTLKVVVMIHWQAIRLFLKGVPYINRSQALDIKVQE